MAVDLSKKALGERIDKHPYDTPENREQKVADIYGKKIDYNYYDNLLIELYNSEFPRAQQYMDILNGKEMADSGIQSLLKCRYDAEIVIPGSTKQGITSFKLYGNGDGPVHTRLPLQDGAYSIFKTARESDPSTTWLTMEGREDLALNYSINRSALKSAIRADISQGKVKEGYCIPGGILGLQILLVASDSEFLIESKDVVHHSIESLIKTARLLTPSEDLKSQCLKLKAIRDDYYPLLAATSQGLKSEKQNMVDDIFGPSNN